MCFCTYVSDLIMKKRELLTTGTAFELQKSVGCSDRR